MDLDLTGKVALVTGSTTGIGYATALGLARMGAGVIVNGPGESKHADIGISLPGTGESPSAPVFIDGKKAMTLRGPDIVKEFKAIVEDYVARRYGTPKLEQQTAS